MNLIEKLHYLMKKNNIRNIAQLSRETNIPYTTLKSIFDGDVNDKYENSSLVLYSCKINKNNKNIHIKA